MTLELRRRRHSMLVAALLLTALAPLSAGSKPDADRRDGWSWTRVIVQSHEGPRAAAAAVRASGGRVRFALPIVDGVAALVPDHAAGSLARDRRIRAVTPDETVTTAEAPGDTEPVPGYSMFVVETNAHRHWRAGRTGRGQRVALIDTGVTPVADLEGRIVGVPHPVHRGQISPCVNFTAEPTCDDSFGHGTFMAGLIAGNGTLSGHRYFGAAPAADIVSLKIAGRSGAADVSKVLAAIQYVVSFKNALNIGVLNLSLGTNSRVSYRHDPLNYAVERAWARGIVVVVSASNRGPAASTISKPADDPYVITVGAVDDRGSAGIEDDRLPDFSGRGPTTTDRLPKPDVVAPGARLVSLRSPGSTIEQTAGTPGVDEHHRRGSGTSMAAAVVSGLVALIREANPTWTPDRVKFALMRTARPVASNDPMAVGSGIVDAHAAAAYSVQPPAGWNQHGASDGSGSLDGSRGDTLVTRQCSQLESILNPKCDRFQGSETAQKQRYDGREYTGTEWTEDGWYTAQWTQAAVNGYSWYDSDWYGYSWYGDYGWEGYSWYGYSWYGTEGSGTSYGSVVKGSTWYGAWL